MADKRTEVVATRVTPKVHDGLRKIAEAARVPVSTLARWVLEDLVKSGYGRYSQKVQR